MFVILQYAYSCQFLALPLGSLLIYYWQILLMHMQTFSNTIVNNATMVMTTMAKDDNHVLLRWQYTGWVCQPE